MEITEELLIQEAIKAKERAYCPYSNFRVGCSLLTKNNKLYTGCNVENASYGLCVCAERVAICKAVSEGDRQISTIVVSCDTDEPTFPCGMCRQTIIEFCYSGNDIIECRLIFIYFIFTFQHLYNQIYFLKLKISKKAKQKNIFPILKSFLQERIIQNQSILKALKQYHLLLFLKILMQILNWKKNDKLFNKKQYTQFPLILYASLLLNQISCNFMLFLITFIFINQLSNFTKKILFQKIIQSNLTIIFIIQIRIYNYIKCFSQLQLNQFNFIFLELDNIKSSCNFKGIISLPNYWYYLLTSKKQYLINKKFMAFVSITNIVVDDKPQPFTSPITMDIYFDVIADIEDEIEWALLYIGSPKDEAHDQILDQFSMGPLTKGTKQFTLESNPPDWKKIPQDELLGITAFILTCSYRQREFFRVGYYVYNTYTSPENIENDPQEVIIEDIARQIFNNKPRITRFEIDWNNPANFEVLQQPIQTKAYMFQEQQEKQSADATDVYDAPHQIQNVFDS